MKKVVFFAAVLLLLALAIPAGAATEWIELSKTGAKCVGATPDGERFLMVETVGEIGPFHDFRAYFADANGRRKAVLFMNDSAEADIFVDMSLEWEGIPSDMKDAFVEKHGGKTVLALRLFPWNRAWLPEATGDRMLLNVAGAIGPLLVDVRTGEAMFLIGSGATLAKDGRVAMVSQGALSVYDPASLTYAPVEVTDADEWLTISARLLSDGEFVCARRSVKMPAWNVEFAFAFLGADGEVTESVSAGTYRLGEQPERFHYSEEAGVGIAFNMSHSLSNPPLIFRRGWPSAKVLLLDQPDGARCRLAEIEETLDEKGALKEPGARALLPLGISADGQRALFVELNVASLLWVDLNTLDVTTVLTHADLSALYAEKNTEYRATIALSVLGWNGNDILAGLTAPAGCALRLG